jgi:hypothetical protein
MRHRMISGTGLGNPEKCLMNNNWTENQELNTAIQIMLYEAINLWFKDIGGVDFEIQFLENGKIIVVDFGIEPAYQYDKLKIYSIDTNKDSSYFMQGKAWGAYGSGIVKTTKYYTDYKNNCKFKKFVDKWSNELSKFVS